MFVRIKAVFSTCGIICTQVRKGGFYSFYGNMSATSVILREYVAFIWQDF